MLPSKYICRVPALVVVTFAILNVVARNSGHALPSDTGAGRPVVVRTTTGVVQGISDQVTGYQVFRGIPFAEPPLGPRRWEPPTAKASWSPAIWDATYFRHACPQLGDLGGHPINMSEDCLYLNIWTPYNASSVTSYPVMVWIYGGGWTQGFGSQSLYWGDYIANTTQTILVTVNYRLGALGFFSWQDSTNDIRGNFGIMDQQLALHWVQNNIKNFGGDPQQVTLFGQSAGGISVATHLTIPSSANLFSRVIIESNPFAIFYRHFSGNQPYSEEFQLLLECLPGDLACLRKKDWKDVLAAQGDTIWLPIPFSSQKVLPWQPVIDDKLIFGQPLKMLTKGIYNKNVKEVVLGTVKDEFVSFVWGSIPLSISSVEYEAGLLAFFGVDQGEAVLGLYPSVSGDNRRPLSDVLTDLFFGCATRRAALALSGLGVPTYVYTFMHYPAVDPLNNVTFCRGIAACHGAELSYVFHSAVLDGFNFYGQESLLSWQTLDYWTSFAHAKFLIPGNGGQGGDATGNTTTPTTLSWPAFEGRGLKSMALDLPLSIQQGYRKDKCDFWDKAGLY